MKRRPKVFISANSSEFRDWRRIATEELLRLKCEPIAMDHFSTGSGSLVEILDGMIRPCDAMICLIGLEYGEPVPGHPQKRSYTQHEYDLASRYGMNQFLLFAADSVTPPQHANDLQKAFREEVRRSGKLWYTFSNEDEFRRQILGMRIEPRGRSPKSWNTGDPGQKKIWPLVSLAVLFCTFAVAAWLIYANRQRGEKEGSNESSVDQLVPPLIIQEMPGGTLEVPPPTSILEDTGPKAVVNIINPTSGSCGLLVIANMSKEFAWCPPGNFFVGFGESEPGASSDDRKESPPREIKMKRGFWISTREFSINEARSCVALGFEFSTAVSLEPDSGDLPVSGVSWMDSTRLCDWLQSRAENGWTVRLPYEVEWEYACRSGEFGMPFFFGSILDGSQANCDARQYPFDGKKRTSQPGRTVGEAVKVDSYLPNAWHLYNMHGNVREWCADYFAPIFDIQTNFAEVPSGPKSGSDRVLRGGFWGSRGRSCRAASRESAKPDIPVEGAGIRLLLQKN